MLRSLKSQCKNTKIRKRLSSPSRKQIILSYIERQGHPSLKENSVFVLSRWVWPWLICLPAYCHLWYEVLKRRSLILFKASNCELSIYLHILCSTFSCQKWIILTDTNNISYRQLRRSLEDIVKYYYYQYYHVIIPIQFVIFKCVIDGWKPSTNEI